MKIVDNKPEFKPVTLVIETQGEWDLLAALFGALTPSSAEKFGITNPMDLDEIRSMFNKKRSTDALFFDHIKICGKLLGGSS